MSSEQVGNLPVSEAVQPAFALRYHPYETVTRWRPLPALLIAFVFFAVTQGMAAVVLHAVADADSLASGGLPKAGSQVMGQVMGLWLGTQLCLCALVLMALWWKGDRFADALALKAPAGGAATYFKALALLLAVVGVYSYLSLTFFRNETRADMQGMADLIRGPAWPMALAVVSVGAPLSEELLVRGFMQSALVPTRLGYWGASVVTSTLWALMHFQYSWVGLLEIFIIGLVFCAILRRSGSLRATVFGHAVYNCLVALAMIFLPKDWLGF